MMTSTQISLPQPLLHLRVMPAGPEPKTSEAIDRGQQEAFERGRQEAERSLTEQLLKQRTEIIELQQNVLESLRRVGPQVAEDCKRSLIALTLQIAEKLVSALPVSREMVEAAVTEALAQVKDATEVNLYLHPDDLKLMEQFQAARTANTTVGPRLNLHSAPEISRGGCVAKTNFGTIDARREVKLNLLQQSLLS